MSTETRDVIGHPLPSVAPRGRPGQQLIEQWLPLNELGIDAGRERRAIGHLPPLFLIHLWWARRPVGVCQGVQLTALLPAWQLGLLNEVDGLRDAIKDQTFLPSSTWEDRYRNWVLWVSGIRGDNVTGQIAYDAGDSAGDAWPWVKAWQALPTDEDVRVLHELLVHRWGRIPSVLDPTAGGGSIPYAALRYGLHAIANDLNPIAVSSMLGSIAVPGLLGSDVRKLVKQWAIGYVTR